MKKHLTLILLALCCFGTTFSSIYKKYDVRSGMSGNCVRSIIQDSIGYMWFATQDGLNRFNGLEFINYGHSSIKDDNNYLNIVTIHNHIDNNHIWVASTEKLFLFDIKQEIFIPFDKLTNKGISVHSVFDIEYDNKGQLWLATANGLFRYDEKNDILDLYKYSPNEINTLPSNHIWVVYKDMSGTMWIGTRNGLAKYNEKSNDFTVYISNEKINDRPACNEIISIIETAPGSIWLGTWYGGIAQFDIPSKEFTYYYGEGDKMSIPRIRSLYQYSANTLYLGSDNGLYIFNTKTKECISSSDDLSHESVYALYQDNEGSLWFGTYYSGVRYLSVKHKDFEWYYDTGMSESLSGNVISQFCEDPDGNIWIATEDGGLNHFNPKTKKFKYYAIDEPNNKGNKQNIHALLYDNDKLWIGTFSKGLYIMDLKTGKFRNYRHSSDPNSIINDHIYSLYKRRDGTICIGTLTGFCTYNPKTDSFISIPELNNIFIYDMAEDNQGNLWLASKRSGVWVNWNAKNHFQNYLHNPEDSTSLANNWVIGIHIDSKDNLWFCTEGNGISRYDYDKNSFENYSTNENLPNKIIYGILSDISGNLWLSSNNGLFRYEPHTKRVQLYNVEDGLQSNQFNFRSAFCSSKGEFYFGGVNGFNSFYPSRLSVNRTKPNAAISSVYTYRTADKINQSQRIGVLNGSVSIPYQAISFDITFESLSFVSPNKNMYAYRIDNVHKEWIYTNKPSVSFTNLAPGNYTFRLKTSNNDGYWSDENTVLMIEVCPTPWNTTLARTIYLIIILTIIYLFIKYYIKRQRLTKFNKLKEIEHQKSQELYQAKIAFFTQIAHEVKTPVSLIKAPLDAIMEAQEWNKDVTFNLGIIRKNTNRLLELIKQLLDFKKIDQDGYTLSLYDIDINELILEILDGFKAISLSGINIQSNLSEEHLTYSVDKEALTKIVSNLLSNSIKHAKTLITISTYEEKIDNVKTLIISVKDDGNGISEENYTKVFEPFYQETNQGTGDGIGIGLSLVKLLVEKHEGKVYINADYKTGCEVRVHIPKLDNKPKDEKEKLAISDTINERSDNEPKCEIEHTLLIVEDTSDMQDFLANHLKDYYTIYTAYNGCEALEILENNPIDVIISDIVMPQMDGFDLLKNVRADQMICHTPFILLSAQDTTSSKIAGLEYGADAYIEKPFSMDHIIATINNLLENRRMLFNHFSSTPNITYDQISMNKSDTIWLAKVNDIITSNFTNEQFTIDRLAEEMATSRSFMQRKLKGLVGMPPNDYVRLIRLKRAAELLLNGEYRINEVCYIVGFNNPSYFARCFQKQFGILPKDYAKQIISPKDEPH